MPPSIWVRLLLRAYPRALRRDHGHELALAVSEELRRARGARSRVSWLVRILGDALATRRHSPRRPADAGDGRRPNWWPGFATELRSALRVVRAAPGMTAGAVLTLGLGIGAATAMFSVAHATLLRPLPIPNAERVLQSTFSWSYPDVRDLERGLEHFATVAAWANLPVGLDFRGDVRPVVATAISGGYPRTIALPVIAGRWLDEQDDRAGAPLTAVISERMWTERLDRDPNILGAIIAVNRQPVTVVGIAPAAFRGLSLREQPELFVSLAAAPRLATGFLTRPGILDNRGAVWIQVAGRLRDGASEAQGEREVEAAYWRPRPPSTEAREPLTMVPLPVRAAGLDTSADLRQFVYVLLGAAATILLLSCATVANLLLVRADRRTAELAVRAALGAGRHRLVRLVTVESLLIGLAGAAAGVALAVLCVSLLDTFSLPGGVSMAGLSLTLHPAMLAFAIGAGVLTSLLFGLAPLRRMLTLDVLEILRGHRAVSPRQPLRTILVATQVAACVALLAGGLAFGRAVREAFTTTLGFDTQRTAMLTIDTSLVRYTRDQTADVLRRSVEALDAAPWVRAAGWAAMRPLSGRMIWQITMPDYRPAGANDLSIDANIVTPGYFAALGIPIVRGRAFAAADRADAPYVGIVSEAFVRRFFPGATPIGVRINLDGDRPERPESWMTIVGIAGDIRRGPGRAVDPMLYLPLAQRPSTLDFAHHLFVSSDQLAPDAAAAEAAALMRRVDPLLPISRVMPVRAHLADAAMSYRLGLTLFALFGSLAAVLTTFGVYAIVSSAVTSRRREIGIRVALGATAPGVLALVARQGALPILAGAAAGATAYALSGRLIAAFLLSVPVIDATTVAALAIGIGVIAGVALVVPSRRALAVDPASVLRDE